MRTRIFFFLSIKFFYFAKSSFKKSWKNIKTTLNCEKLLTIKKKKDFNEWTRNEIESDKRTKGVKEKFWNILKVTRRNKKNCIQSPWYMKCDKGDLIKLTNKESWGESFYTFVNLNKWRI